MQQSFIIIGTLPSLNEQINANRTNRYLGAQVKKNVEEAIGWAIRKHKLKPMRSPVRFYIRYFEPTRRRDKDNICSAKKYILDSLVSQGILKGDRWKDIIDVQPFVESFLVDKLNPRIEVIIEEV